MSATLVVTGGCRMQRWPWQGTGGAVPTCDKGVLGCYGSHTVRREGTKCSYCKTDGGHYTCPECDRGLFSCSNYAGTYEG